MKLFQETTKMSVEANISNFADFIPHQPEDHLPLFPYQLLRKTLTP